MAGSKNSNYFDFLKKLAPTLAKEEGDIINRQLAKELTETGAQLDNPALSEQLKGLVIPERKGIVIPEEYFPSPPLKPTPGGALGDVIPDAQVEQHGLHLGEIIPNPKEPYKGMVPKERTNPYIGDEIPQAPKREPLYQDPVPMEGGLGEVIPEQPLKINLVPEQQGKQLEAMGPFDMSSESYGPNLASKWDTLKQHKGKILAGGAAAAGLALMNRGGQSGEKQAITKAASTESPNIAKIPEIKEPETEEEKAVKAQIRQLSSTSGGSGDQPTVVDFGSAPSIASLERLQQLQQQANQDSRWARMAQAFSQARAGMTGQAEDRFSKGYDEDIKAIQNVPEQYKQQVAFEKEDPNSPISKGYRDLAKKVYDIDIQGSASAADIEKQFPQFANLKSGKEARLARAEELKLRYAAMQDTKKQAADLKNQDKQTKAIENYAKIASKEYERLSKLEQAVQALDMKNIKDSGPSDVAALYSFIKLLDPESVVREGEIALARSGMSMPQRLRNAIKNAAYGGVIDKEFRAEMAIIGKHLAEQGSSRYHKSLAHQRNILKNRYNLKDEDIAEYDPALVASKQPESPPIPKQPMGSNISSKEPIGKSGLTPQQRQAEIQQLRQELGIK